MDTSGKVILEVRKLSVAFEQYGRGLKRKVIHAVEDLSLTVSEREIVAVVGSSGSGKSLLAHAIMGILPYNAAMNGELVIADEPTPGLHPEAARRVMEHFKEIAKGGAGVLLITHDLELALLTADRVVVLYGGRAIEEAQAAAFSDESQLKHPYTKALCRSMPQNWDPSGDRLCVSGEILAYMRKEYGR